ncbi:MAG: hypothetical protein LBM73_02190 [Candidatus Nomurabacteria bacterium]|jgi:hypothetical protein|nr:hypothetical protein [Candidatus Nomurabacteria bacterium]
MKKQFGSKLARGIFLTKPGDARFAAWLGLRRKFVVETMRWLSADECGDDRDLYDAHPATRQLVATLGGGEIVAGVRATILNWREITPEKFMTLKMALNSPLKNQMQKLIKDDHILARWRTTAWDGGLVDLTRFCVRWVPRRRGRKIIIARQKIQYARLALALIRLLKNNPRLNARSRAVGLTSPKFVEFLKKVNVDLRVVALAGETVLVELKFPARFLEK